MLFTAHGTDSGYQDRPYAELQTKSPCISKEENPTENVLTTVELNKKSIIQRYLENPQILALSLARHVTLDSSAEPAAPNRAVVRGWAAWGTAGSRGRGCSHGLGDSGEEAPADLTTEPTCPTLNLSVLLPGR